MFHNRQPKDEQLMDPKWFGTQTHLQLPGIPSTLLLPGKPSAGGPGCDLDASRLLFPGPGGEEAAGADEMLLRAKPRIWEEPGSH